VIGEVLNFERGVIQEDAAFVRFSTRQVAIQLYAGYEKPYGAFAICPADRRLRIAAG